MPSTHFGESGFLAKSDRSPVSLGLAFTVTGAGLAALLLAKPYIVQHFTPPPTVIESIAVPKPPEPPVVRQPRTQTDPKPSLTPPAAQPDSSTAVTSDPGPSLSFPPMQPFDSLGAGNGPTVAPIDPPAIPIFVGAQPDPRYARDRQPPYPANLQREEIEGRVTVRVHVGTDGRVLQIESISTDREEFLKATRDWALKHWRFKPATSDGVPVESWRTMSVTFTIDRQ